MQRLEFFFTANGVEENAQKKAVLLTVVGPMMFKLLRSLVALVKVENEAYDELLTAMRDYCCSKPSSADIQV